MLALRVMRFQLLKPGSLTTLSLTSAQSGLGVTPPAMSRNSPDALGRAGGQQGAGCPFDGLLLSVWRGRVSSARCSADEPWGHRVTAL